MPSDGTDSDSCATTASYDAEEEEEDSMSDMDNGLADLASGWDDGMGAPRQQKRRRTHYEQMATGAPTAVDAGAPTAWDVYVGAGLLERAMNGMADARVIRVGKRGRTPDPPAAPVAKKRPHYMSLMLLYHRALADPGSFPVAPMLRGLDVDTMMHILLHADFGMMRTEKIRASATGDSGAVHLDWRNMSDSEAAEVFDHSSCLSGVPDKLYLSHNNFGAAGARSLGAALERARSADNSGVRNAQIEHISLNNTPIGADGAVAVLAALPTSWGGGPRTVIEMANIGLRGAEDGKAVARAIVAHAPWLSVRFIDLSRNDIGNEGIRAIADAARYVCGLQAMNLCGCGGDDDRLDEITNLIYATTTVDSLHLCTRADTHTAADYTPVSRRHTDRHTKVWNTRMRKDPVRMRVWSRRPRVLSVRSLWCDPSVASVFTLVYEMCRIRVGADTAFSDILNGMMECAQDVDRGTYMAPAGAKLVVDTSEWAPPATLIGMPSPDVRALEPDVGMNGWAGLFAQTLCATGLPRFLPHSTPSTVLTTFSTPATVLNLLTVHPSETRRRAAVIFSIAHTLRAAVPTDIVKIILSAATMYHTATTWRIMVDCLPKIQNWPPIKMA